MKHRSLVSYLRLTPLILAFAISLTSCQALLQREYVKQEPHELDEPAQLPTGTATVKDIEELKNIIILMVQNGVTHKEISTENYSGDFSEDLRRILQELQKTEPVMLYYVFYMPVETIQSALTKSVVALDIVYKQNAVPYNEIEKIHNSAAFALAIKKAVAGLEKQLVIETFYYNEQTYKADEVVKNYIDEHPEVVLTLPTINSISYPDNLAHRILELNFDYDRNDILAKSSDLHSRTLEIFEEFPEGLTQYEIARYFYEFTRGITLGDSDNSAYGALCDYTANSQGFALATALLCRNAGLEVQIISGKREQSDWFWCLVKIDGEWYHLDTTHWSDKTSFLLKSDKFMKNRNYAWDGDKYPKAEKSYE